MDTPTEKIQISMLVPLELREWYEARAEDNRRTLSAEIQVAMEMVREWTETATAEKGRPW